MKKIEYQRANCPSAPSNYNRGQALEWRIRYELTGATARADNRKGCEGADCNGYQIKSPKASLIDNDKCNGYIFALENDNGFYVMSRAEFKQFADLFSYLDHDSRSHKAKRRIKNDSKIMRNYLATRVQRAPQVPPQKEKNK